MLRRLGVFLLSFFSIFHCPRAVAYMNFLSTSLIRSHSFSFMQFHSPFRSILLYYLTLHHSSCISLSLIFFFSPCFACHLCVARGVLGVWRVAYAKTQYAWYRVFNFLFGTVQFCGRLLKYIQSVGGSESTCIRNGMLLVNVRCV